MAMYRIHIAEVAARRYAAIAKETGETIHDLMCNALEEAALNFYRDRGFRDDPAKTGNQVRVPDTEDIYE